VAASPAAEPLGPARPHEIGPTPRVAAETLQEGRQIARQVLQQRLQVMDATAISLCMDNRLPIVVFNMNESGNIRRVVMGDAVGTTVTA